MPGYSTSVLKDIYDRTGGYCHLCGKKLALTNYGQHGEKGAWEVDHSVAQARGGGDHGNNLAAACTSCNRSKQDMTTRAARARNGITCRPDSRQQRRDDAAFRDGLTAVGILGGLAWVAWKIFGKRGGTPGSEGDPSV